MRSLLLLHRPLRPEQRQILAVSLCFEAVHWDEAHSRGIHAVAQPARAWAIIEQVSEMRIRLRRAHLDATHEEGVVLLLLYVRWLQRLGEARPARAGLEL